MLRFFRFLLALCVLSSVYCANISAQTKNGVLPFGSAAGGPDTINLANLNVDIDVPIRNKAGRGMNFVYDLNYDSLIWSVVTSGGTNSWQPSSQWGWSGLQPAGTSYVSYSVVFTSGHCGYQGQSSYQEWIYSNFAYYDNFGVWHQFNGISGDYYSSPGGGTCPPNGPQPTMPMSQLASDGSGFTLTVTLGNSGQGQPSAYVKDKNGSTFGVTVGAPPTNAPTSATDRNGNVISQSNGVYSDTLGTTALTLVSLPPTSTTLSYAAPSGAAASYVVSYKGYIVRTAFGCSGITEYNSGSSQISLVDKITLPDLSFYQFEYEPTPGFSGDVTGRIASVTFPAGGQIVYGYAGGSSGHIMCSGGSPATLTRHTPDGTWTYALGAGSTSTTTITDPTTPTANQTVIQFQGMYETERKIYQGSSTSGTLLQTVDTCYNASTSPCTTIAIALPITQTSRIVTLPGAANLQSKVVNSYNTSGLVTETDSYDYGSGAPPASPLKKTIIGYAALGNGIASMPASVIVQDGGGNVKAQTNYIYDQGTVTATSGTPQHASVTGSRGNATTISQLVQGTTTLNSTATYYDTGTINTSTDVNGAVTTLNYSNATATCGNAFATSVSEPLSLSRSMTWNCTGGVQLTSVDENIQTITTTYNDPYFWRPNDIKDQVLVNTAIGYSPGGVGISPYFYVGNNSIVGVGHNFDGLGRPSFDQRYQSIGGLNFDTVSYTYDSNGRPYSTSVPCSVGAGSNCPSTTPKTTQTYDALNRPLLTTDGGGRTTNYSYSQNDVLVTTGPAPSGENTKRRQLEYNGLGQLTSVCELTGATQSGTCRQNSPVTGYWTEYTYDPLGNLTGVTQNAQPGGTAQSRSYSYDGLSRIKSETNPESGTTTYSYDSVADGSCVATSNGDLIEKQDARGDKPCYSHDTLHRLTSVGSQGPQAGVTPDLCYRYDGATVNGVGMSGVSGRLAEAYTVAHGTGCGATMITDEGFSYTARGEVSDVYEATPHSNGYYHISQTYWAHGLPEQLSTNISGFPTITYGGTIGSTVGLDGEGRITQVTASGTGQQNPVTGVSYNNAGLPVQVNFGSGDFDSFGFDANTLRMTSYQFNVGTQSKSLKGILTWNANASLGQLAITDQFNAADTQTCTYAHDDLVRIASANCGSAAAQTFAYDPFGNINKSGSPNSFQPTYSPATNRMTSLPGNFTPTYDANGNIMNDSNHTYSWDAEGNSIAVDSVGLTYDALHRMVEQNRSGTYTEIVYSPSGSKQALMGSNGGQTLQKAFVPLPGHATAIYTGSGLDHYRHADWLGSARLTSTGSRAVSSTVAYAPFGESYAQFGTSDLSFTGQDQDTIAGAAADYDFVYRKYSTEGRWPSPDPAGLKAVDPMFPQSWNRYAYVLNNPLSSVDPLGYECVWDNGSFDAEDDPSTGNPGGCQDAGGTWIELGQQGNWTSQGDTGIAGVVAGIQSGQYNFATAIGLDGSVYATGYDQQGRTSWTDYGGVVTGYSYFSDDLNPSGSMAWSDPGGMYASAFRAWQTDAFHQFLNTMSPDEQRIWQLGNMLNVPFMNLHQGCETEFYLGIAGGAAGMPIEMPIWAGRAIYGGNGVITAAAIVCKMNGE